MMKKIVFSVLLCSSLLGLSACEDKAEKRAKLQAQREAASKKYSSCLHKNTKWDDTINADRVDSDACKAEQEKIVSIQNEIDKLNM